MIIYIYGEDTYRSRSYREQVIEQFKKQRDPQGYNVAVLDVVKSSSDKILGELFAAPFLAERRMVVMDNALSGSAGLLEKLTEIIKEKKIPDSTALVVWQGEKLGKSKDVKTLYELLAKEKYAREFGLMAGPEFIQWVKSELAARQASIGVHAINFLCDNVSGDSWLASSLIKQLSAYVGGREINLDDVKLFLDFKTDDNIFGMTDAIAAGNLRSAVKLISDQRRLGKDEGYLFAMILRQFKILLQIRDYLERSDNTTSDAMAKDMGVHPFVVKKSLAIAKKYRLDDLRRIYDELLQIDIQTKTGLGEQGALIDLFLARHGV